MIKRLKQMNRGLLELNLGILFWGIAFLIVGCFLVSKPFLYAVSLMIGVLLALISTYHMYRMLERALELGEKASGTITAANLFRYVCIIIVFVLVWLTGKLNPVFTFLGLMTLKGAAYVQPLTRKICDKVFGENGEE